MEWPKFFEAIWFFYGERSYIKSARRYPSI